MNIFNKWLNKPAKWYYFWLPQSGAIGGLIAALATWIILNLVFLLVLLVRL